MDRNEFEAMTDIPATETATSVAEVIPIRVKPLSDIDSMDGYLGSYGKILGLKAIEALSPLHVPERDTLPDFGDIPSNREPFDCQKHVIAATVKMMDRVGSGFIVGEMGTGKSLMGAVGVDRHTRRSRKKGGKNGRYRALVLAPDHLVKKWCREIEETLPDATATRFGVPDAEEVFSKKGKKGGKAESSTRLTLRDIVALLDGRSNGGRWPKPRGPEWYVLGRNQAKWLSDWVGIADKGPRFGGKTPTKSLASKTVIIDRVHEKDEYGRVLKTKNVLGSVYVCPKCGCKQVDKKGVPLSEKDFMAKTKGTSQRVCSGTYAIEIPDYDKPRHEGLDRLCPIPDRFREKKPADPKAGRPADTFPQGGRRYRVMACGEPLYNYVSKPVRWSPARIIQKKMKRFFDYLVIDEVHEQKSDESAQSMSCGKLISAAKHTIALTGTIIGGYADHLYPLMMRITPKTLRDEGFEWGKSMEFSEKYGRIDTVTKTTEDGGGTSVGGNVKSMRKAKPGESKSKQYVRPGVMPTMFGRHMLGSSMFITLDELAENLPDLFEYIGGPHPTEPERDDFDAPGRTPEEADAAYEAAMDLYTRSSEGYFDTAVDMDFEQSTEYRRIKARLEEANADLLKNGSMKLLGAYLWTTMDYPDKPFGWGYEPEVKKSITEAEAEGKHAPALLGQSFLSHFDHGFDPGSESLVLKRTMDGVVEEAKVPLKKDGGIYWLDVQFNGSATRSLAYDTGAAYISLPESMANEVGLKPKEGDSQIGMQVADGSVHQARETTIPSVTIGGFTVRDVKCVVVPTSGLPHTIGYWREKGNKKIENWIGVVTPRDLPEDVISPKEQALIDICKKQKKDGSQTWVYVNMTGKRNIQPRLKKLLEAEGLKVGILRSTDVEPIEREAWIAKHGRDFDVMISHPQLVSTGLDLFSKAEGGHNYSSLVFYETGYNLFTMRQAARRAWRIGQPHDCRVYYLYYRDTMQHNAMSLMSKKMAAAQALEGEFSEEGLAAMAGEDNMQMALAKSLADRIDDSDIQRSWSKVKSGSPKKVTRRPGDALKQAADTTPSLFDGLPAELQLVGESLAKAFAEKKDDALSRMLDEAESNLAPTMEEGLKLDEARIDATEALVDDSLKANPIPWHLAPEAEEPGEEPELDPDFFAELGSQLDEFEVYEDHDEDFVMPDLTEDTLAKLFTQMAEGNGWS